MTFKLLNRLGMVGTLAFIAGLFLVFFRMQFGGYIMIAGAVVSIVGKVGSIVYGAKNILKCPKCGESLQTYANRTRRSGVSGHSDIVTCGKCGTKVDLIELYKSNKL